MARLSAIEKWFYGLAYLEADNVGRRFPGKLRTETNPFKHSETSSTSTYTPDRAMHRAMGVKMVADELLAAAGTVVGATSGFFAFASNPLRGPRIMMHGAQMGETIGRNVGSMMWSVIN